MPEDNPKRRLQFSIRKLLIWMAVVAAYCGVGKVIPEPLGLMYYYTPGEVIILGCLAVLAAILRIVIAWPEFTQY